MKLLINEDIMHFRTAFYLEDDQKQIYGFDGSSIVSIDGNKLDLTAEADIQPLIVGPVSMKHAIIKAFAEYASEIGLKTESDFKIQGKLEAQQKHLASVESTLDRIIRATLEKDNFKPQTPIL